MKGGGRLGGGDNACHTPLRPKQECTLPHAWSLLILLLRSSNLVGSKGLLGIILEGRDCLASLLFV